jgi:hypothetical protein
MGQKDGKKEEENEVLVQKGIEEEDEEAPRMSSPVVLVEDHSPNISFFSPVRRRYAEFSSLEGEEEEAPRMSSPVVLVEDHSPNISFYSPERRRCVEFSP